MSDSPEGYGESEITAAKKNSELRERLCRRIRNGSNKNLATAMFNAIAALPLRASFGWSRKFFMLPPIHIHGLCHRLQKICGTNRT